MLPRLDGLFASLLVVAVWCSSQAKAQQELAGQLAWTLESARAELKLRPDDPYIQFVVSQLAHAQQGDTASESERDRLRRQSAQRHSQVNLFSIFSGTLAVQESLQIDALTGSQATEPEARTIATGSLQGPTVQSHPWEEMLAGQKPELSELAQYVPDDQLYVHFASVGKLLDMRSLLNDYGTYVTSQINARALSTDSIDRLQDQLALQVSNLLRPVYDAAIAELAITSSDLFFMQGTDVTLVFKLNEEVLIRSQFDAMLDAAATGDEVTNETGEYLGISFRHVATKDGSTHVFSAYPKPDVHVRSNSRRAMQRAIATIAQKPYDGELIRPLSSSTEFQYIRTLMPLGAEEEDGLIYMSDPFIREQIGATKKLTQRSRLICNANLQLLAHASLFYQTQYGSRPTSISDLRNAACLGSGDAPLELTCPEGGSYTLSDDGSRGCCSHHGCLHNLKPCIEIPKKQVSEREAELYKQFVQEYSQYWRTFFDPIAIRIRHSEKNTRVETIVLPLINNSIYQSLARTLSGEQENLNLLPIPDSNIFSLVAHVDKQQLLPGLDLANSPTSPANEAKQRLSDAISSHQQLALAMLNFESAYRHLPPLPLRPGASTAKPSGLSWRVHVLPFLGESALFNQFHLNEPWDSEHNRSLISQMPKVFETGQSELTEQGKTRFVRPYHSDAAYSSLTKGSSLSHIVDGTSNTILTVVADTQRAVVWTKPEDLDIDIGRPREGWSDGIESVVPFSKVDGSIARLPRELPNAQVKALLTRAGAEKIDFDLPRLAPSRPRTRSSFPFSMLSTEERQLLSQYVRDGIGDQIGVHICDADPLIDFNVARFMGMMGSVLGDSNSLVFGPSAAFSLLAISLNAPVYVAIPVKDKELTDFFLHELDRSLLAMTREANRETNSFIFVQQDVYKIQSQGESDMRAYAFRFGPLTWRFYWARIDDGLYIASKPEIIHRLREAHREPPVQGPPLVSHGLVHVRPDNWNRVKPHYTIGWNESERRACMNNLGPLADIARAEGAQRHSIAHTQVQSRAAQSRQFRYFCPCGGHYSHSAEALATCSVHGSVNSPTQPIRAPNGNLNQLVSQLSDVRLQLSFLEDGLHAVVTIERK